MRRLYPHDAPPLYRPPLAAWRAIHAGIVGGRVDTLAHPSRRYGRLLELDMNAAYPATARRIPSGTATVYAGALPAYAVAGIQRCTVTLPAANLPLGPLPYRLGNGRVTYPDTACSTFEGWFWTEEQAAAASVGIAVERHEGVCWPRWSEALAPWAEAMFAYRAAAPSETVRGLVKLCTVAALGRFGSDLEAGELVAEPPAAGRWQWYTDPQSGISAYVLKEEERDREGLLVHVSSFIHANVRLATWRKALGYAAQGRLVATNYDAVYALPLKGNDIIDSSDMGAWKARMLSHARIRAPRWLESAEKTRTPGQRRISA
jgi:hypothetical protein